MSQNTEEIRAFIAVELPDEVRQGLARLRKALKRDEHRFVKWVDPEGIHLTLKFLGNIPSRLVPGITGAMEAAAKGIPSVGLEISGLGAFPRLEQVRVLWVGVGGEVHRLKDCSSASMPNSPRWDSPERNAPLHRTLPWLE